MTHGSGLTMQSRYRISHHSAKFPPSGTSWAWDIAFALGTLASAADDGYKRQALRTISALGERHVEALPALLKIGSAVEPSM